MKSLFLCFFLITIVFAANTEPPKVKKVQPGKIIEKKVVDTSKKPAQKVTDPVESLGDKNFQEVKSKEKTLIVLFYSGTCPHSKKLMPEFTKACEALSKYGIKLAKVEATINRGLAELYQIQVFPTIIGFHENEEKTYINKRNWVNIFNWAIKNYHETPLHLLKTEQEIKSYLKDNEVSLIYFNTEGEQLSKKKQMLEQSAIKVEDFPIALVTEEKLFSLYNAKKDLLVLFKNTDEKRQELEDPKDAKQIYDFAYKFAYPRVMRFNDEMSTIIFERNQSGLVFFPEEKKTEDCIKLLKKVGEKINYKIKLVYSDPGLAYSKKLAEYVGVKKKDFPCVRILDNLNGENAKMYELEIKDKSEINEENLIKFINDWHDGKLKQAFKSQEEPKNNRGPVYTIVSKNYRNKVIENDNDVMVVFAAPWCGHCKLLAQTYKEMAQKLQGNKKLYLATIDATENDVEGVEIDGYPTVLFYPANKKNKKPIEYEGDRTVDDMIKFIQKHAVNKVEVAEVKKKTDDNVKRVVTTVGKKEDKKKDEKKKEEKKKEDKKKDEKKKEEKKKEDKKKDEKKKEEKKKKEEDHVTDL